MKFGAAFVHRQLGPGHTFEDVTARLMRARKWFAFTSSFRAVLWYCAQRRKTPDMPSLYLARRKPRRLRGDWQELVIAWRAIAEKTE